MLSNQLQEPDEDCTAGREALVARWPRSRSGLLYSTMAWDSREPPEGCGFERMTRICMQNEAHYRFPSAPSSRCRSAARVNTRLFIAGTPFANRSLQKYKVCKDEHQRTRGLFMPRKDLEVKYDIWHAICLSALTRYRSSFL